MKYNLYYRNMFGKLSEHENINNTLLDKCVMELNRLKYTFKDMSKFFVTEEAENLTYTWRLIEDDS